MTRRLRKIVDDEITPVVPVIKLSFNLESNPILYSFFPLVSFSYDVYGMEY